MKFVKGLIILVIIGLAILTALELEATEAGGCHYTSSGSDIKCETEKHAKFFRLNEEGSPSGEAQTGTEATWEVEEAIIHIYWGTDAVLYRCQNRGCDPIMWTFQLIEIHEMGQFGTTFVYDFSTSMSQIGIPIKLNVKTNCDPHSADEFNWEISTLRSFVISDTVLEGYIQQQRQQSVWSLYTGSGHLLMSNFVDAPNCWNEIPQKTYLPIVNR